jgi:hypothetical protein
MQSLNSSSMGDATAMKGASPSRDSANQAEQVRLQILWEKTMDHPIKFVRYEYVGVLLLSWDDTCDDLYTSEEVRILQHIGHFEPSADIK